jgi:hypothetical protein
LTRPEDDWEGLIHIADYYILIKTVVLIGRMILFNVYVVYGVRGNHKLSTTVLLFFLIL